MLLLLEALVAPSVLASSAAADAHDADATGSVHSSTDAAARAARANGVAVLEARGVPLLVDVLAGVGGCSAGGKMGRHWWCHRWAGRPAHLPSFLA